MATTTYQVVGFLLSMLGLAGCIAATAMDMWSTQDLYDNPVTSVFQYEGLWRSCVRQSSGFTECRPYFTILGLPGRLLGCGRTEQGPAHRAGTSTQSRDQRTNAPLAFLPLSVTLAAPAQDKSWE